MVRKRRKGGFYDELYTEQELSDVAEAVQNGSLEEVALLRVLIRRAVGENARLADVTRVVEALGKMLKVQHAIKGTAAKNLEEALAKVLDEIGNELGVEL